MFDGQVIIWAALIACFLDAIWGYPQALFRRIGHPVTWVGALITSLEARLNTQPVSEKKGRWRGMMCLTAIIMPAGFLASLWEVGIVHLFPVRAQPVLLGLCAAPFIAQKSLRRHVSDVAQALSHRGLAAGRRAVAHIVGRDVRALDESGVARAAIESLAENFSDGVIAPLFWFLMAGLPGLVIYKAVNTADSMIGHLNDRYRDFGRAAALTDDVLNAIPARLTAILVVLVAGNYTASCGALQVARREGPRHRSFNAGWPEGAMAGALDIRLAGPRRYDGVMTDDPFLNPSGRHPAARDVARALRLYGRACVLFVTIIGLLCMTATR